MKYADVSGLSEKELSMKANELRSQLFQARMKNALGQLTNPMTIREMRRDVARMKTAISAKTAGAVTPSKAAAKTPLKTPGKTTVAKAPAKKAASKAKAGAKG